MTILPDCPFAEPIHRGKIRESHYHRADMLFHDLSARKVADDHPA